MIAESVKRAESLQATGERLEKRLARIHARITRLQNARLLSGGAFAFALFLAAVKPGWGVAPPAAALFFPVFVYLVIVNRRWSEFQLKLTRLRAFFLRQQLRCEGRAPLVTNNFASDTTGADLDYFGDFSLWTLIDETLTDDGSQELKSWMVSTSYDAGAISERQLMVKTLRRDWWFYTRLTLIADRSEMKHSAQRILEFLQTPLTTSKTVYAYTALIAVWLAWLAMVFTQTPGAIVLYLAFVALHFSMIGRSGESFMKGVGVSHHLSLLFPIFSSLEKRASLRSYAPTIAERGPSREARSLNFAVGLLSTTANPIFHLMINSVTPWSSTGVLLLERARRRLDSSFAHCLKELSRLEALFSLVLFDRYQTQTYPSMTADKLVFSGCYHPLVPRVKVVANDFGFDGVERLGLLTGSNMSGKSTFLRTIGLNQTLANMGAPVFASSFSTRPLAIESCIEVSDSLRDGFSYFYAEVRRLKTLLDSAQSRPSLFLIDEIFRGTNNRERQIGSRAVIETLAHARGSEGFVSTHDLELTSLEGSHVVNLHFREEISQAGEMTFTYRLQKGASPTTNALRIMQLEGLPVRGI